MTEKLSDWRHALCFRANRPMDKEAAHSFQITYSSKEEAIFYLIDDEGKGDEIAVEAPFLTIEPLGVFNFLRRVGPSKTHGSTIPWLRCVAFVIKNYGKSSSSKDETTYRLVAMDIWLNVVPLEADHSSIYMVPGLCRFIMAVKEAAGLLEHVPSRRNPLARLPRRLNDSRLTLEDKLQVRLEAHGEEAITILALPGLRLPLETPSADQVIYVDTLHGSWECQPVVDVSTSWTVVGCLARVPVLYYAYYHSMTALKGRGSDGTSKGPRLVVSSHLHKWEAEAPEGMILVRGWEDMVHLTTSNLNESSVTVVIDAGFYASDGYDDFVVNLTGMMLEEPLAILYSMGRRSALHDYAARHAGSLVTRQNISAVHLVDARRAWDTSASLGSLGGVPLEFISWDVVAWEDIRGIPLHYYRRLSGMMTNFHLGFTPWEPTTESPEMLFMRHLCIRPSQTFPYVASQTPNATELLHACFSPMDITWSPRRVSNIENKLVTLNPYETYVVARGGQELGDMSQEELASVVTVATQNVRSNPMAHFTLCSPDNLPSLIEEFYNQEIRATRARLDTKQKRYDSNLETLEKFEALPPAPTEERVPRRIPPPPPPRPSSSPALNRLAASSISRTTSRTNLPTQGGMSSQGEGPGGVGHSEPNPLDALRALGERLMMMRDSGEETSVVTRQPPATPTLGTSSSVSSVTTASQVPDMATSTALLRDLGIGEGSQGWGNIIPGENISALIWSAIRQQGLDGAGPGTSQFVSGSIALPASSLIMDQATGEVDISLEFTGEPRMIDLGEDSLDVDASEQTGGLEESLLPSEDPLSPRLPPLAPAATFPSGVAASPRSSRLPEPSVVDSPTEASVPLRSPPLTTSLPVATPPPRSPFPSSQGPRPRHRRNRLTRVGVGRVPADLQTVVMTQQLERELALLLEDMASLSKYVKELTLQKARNVSLAHTLVDLVKETCSVCKTEQCQVIVPCMHPLCAACAWRIFTSESSSMAGGRQVKFAPCPCCKATIELSNVFFPILKTPPPTPEETSLASLVDSVSVAVVEALAQWTRDHPARMAMVVANSDVQIQNLTLGIYFYALLYNLPSFKTLLWEPGTPTDPSVGLPIFIVHVQDLAAFPVHLPIEHVFTTFQVDDDLSQLPLYRHYLPNEFKLPPVTTFSWFSTP